MFARLRGLSAGLVTGILLSPIFCIVAFLLVFATSILALARIEWPLQCIEAISILGNPYVTTVVLTCLICMIIGLARQWRFFSFGQDAKQHGLPPSRNFPNHLSH